MDEIECNLEIFMNQLTNQLTIEQIESHLFELQDKKYGEFQAKLIPTVAPETVIGCRCPQLKSYAKELCRAGILNEISENGNCRDGGDNNGRKNTRENSFLLDLPHKYYDENMLHGFIISQEKDFSRSIKFTEDFLPFIDNWAASDTLNPKVFAKHTEELLPYIKKWLQSEKTYTVRFGICTLMRFYLDEKFDAKYLEMVCSVDDHGEYYIKMMQAWYFATALAKQYDAAVVYIEQERLEKWTHNKTIQKACESFRVSEEHKRFLKTQRV